MIEYLAMLKHQHALNNTFSPVPLRISYHVACHLEALGEQMVHNRLKLMKSIPGISITPLQRGCCGMGGTFGSKRSKYDQSIQIGQDLFDGIQDANPDLVVTDCPACRIQIQQGTGLEVAHPVMIFQKAYGL